jgi:thioredoxin 1
MEPLLHELATELGERVVVAKVNVDEQPELAGAAHVRAIPTMHLVHRGEVVDVMIGAQPLPALRAKLDKIATSQPG